MIYVVIHNTRRASIRGSFWPAYCDLIDAGEDAELYRIEVRRGKRVFVPLALRVPWITPRNGFCYSLPTSWEPELAEAVA